MHPPPVVDPETLRLFRRRLAWGLLGLPQPPQDLALALKEFYERWTTSRTPPPVAPWQAALLQRWRSQPRALREVPLDPVLETMVWALAYADECSLNDSFQPMLRRLASEDADLEACKPQLKAAWQQISLAMQRLRAGLGSYSHEAQLTLSKFLSALQHVHDYFRLRQRSCLHEAEMRFAEAVDDWDRLATLMLTGMQPVSSALLWGVLLDVLGDEASQDKLSLWFSEWAMDLAHVLAPYLACFGEARPDCASLLQATEEFGQALLAWHKRPSGWRGEVMPRWHRFTDAIPEPQAPASRPDGFRWLQPRRLPAPSELPGGLYGRWLAGSADAELALQRCWPLARLLVLLAEPSFRRFELAFPEAEIVHATGGWLVTGPNQHSLEAQHALEQTIFA